MSMLLRKISLSQNLILNAFIHIISLPFLRAEGIKCGSFSDGGRLAVTPSGEEGIVTFRS